MLAQAEAIAIRLFTSQEGGQDLWSQLVLNRYDVCEGDDRGVNTVGSISAYWY